MCLFDRMPSIRLLFLPPLRFVDSKGNVLVFPSLAGEGWHLKGDGERWGRKARGGGQPLGGEAKQKLFVRQAKIKPLAQTQVAAVHMGVDRFFYCHLKGRVVIQHQPRPPDRQP